MNLEGITLFSLTRLLQENLAGSRIFKISMPNPHMVVLGLKRERDTVNLIIDVDGSSPCLYLSHDAPDNPAEPPAFCMLLRKHLEDGRITRISQKGLDRIITLEVSILGQGSRILTKQLVVELTGKNANLIFVRDGMVLDSIKHISPAMSTFRVVQPGVPYAAPPEQDGLPLLTTPPAEIVATLPDEVERNLPGLLVKNTTGIGKTTAQQLFTLAEIPLEATYLTPRDREKLAEAIAFVQWSCLGRTGAGSEINTPESSREPESMTDSIGAPGSAPLPEPCYTMWISSTNRCKTIFPFAAPYLPPKHRRMDFDDLNEALAYASRLEPVQLPEHEQLEKIVAREVSRLAKKTVNLEKDLAEAENADSQRIIADSLMAALYQLKQGMTECTVPNIYDGTTLTVSLSPVVSPAENAQRYYKKYNKLKRAREEVALQLEETRELLGYLETVQESLVTATTRPEVEEIREELVRAGLIRQPKKKRPPMEKSRPMAVRISPETTIYIGKNNRQNDFVTFSIGGGDDLWFHVQKAPGSHVLLKTSLPQPLAEDIATATELAAYFSKSRDGSNVPVDCTLRKFVKKPSGAKPGFVIFTNQTTYYVTPDALALETLLREKGGVAKR